MAFNPDFSQANEAISRAAAAFMQDWVGRRNDKRSMEYLNRSGEMWNEKSENDAALEIARMMKQHELSSQSKESQWLNDVSKLPEGRALMAAIQKRELNGEDATDLVGRLRQMYEEIAPGIEGVMTDYDTSGKNIMSLMGLFENPLEAGVQAMRNRAGDKDRELGWAELSWDRQKKGIEKTDDATKGYLKKISDLRSFYTKIRSGDAVIYLDPATKLPKEIDSTQMSKEQLADIDDMLTQMARIESKFLSGNISENDVEWLDQGWDYTSKSLAMTNAAKKVKTGEYENFDQGVEREWSLLQSKEGKTDRDFRIGAPVEDALDEATGGEFTFDPATPIELKKILWETYQAVKADLQLDESGRGVVDDADIWAMILEDEQVGAIARRYVRAKKRRKEEPIDSPDTPALEEEKTGGK